MQALAHTGVTEDLTQRGGRRILRLSARSPNGYGRIELFALIFIGTSHNHWRAAGRHPEWSAANTALQDADPDNREPIVAPTLRRRRQAMPNYRYIILFHRRMQYPLVPSARSGSRLCPAFRRPAEIGQKWFLYSKLLPLGFVRPISGSFVDSAGSFVDSLGSFVANCRGICDTAGKLSHQMRQPGAWCRVICDNPSAFVASDATLPMPPRQSLLLWERHATGLLARM